MEKFDYPEVVVDTSIVNKEGDILFVRSFKWPDLYSCMEGMWSR